MKSYLKTAACFLSIFSFAFSFAETDQSTSAFRIDCPLISGSIEKKEPITLNSFMNPDWDGWKDKALGYGDVSKKFPVPIFVNAPISTDSTIIVRGQSPEKKRWGLHVFEAYAYDQTSRLTMLLNKHIEEEMPVAEIYYFGADYTQTSNGYYWTRVGSDVPYRSYMFSRDKAIFYGTTELRNLLVLDSVSRENLRKDQPSRKEKYEVIFAKFEKENDRANFKSDMDYKHAKYGEFYKEELKWIRYEALQNAKDGSIFYDADLKALVIKVDGKWMKAKLEALPESYNFNK